MTPRRVSSPTPSPPSPPLPHRQPHSRSPRCAALCFAAPRPSTAGALRSTSGNAPIRAGPPTSCRRRRSSPVYPVSTQRTTGITQSTLCAYPSRPASFLQAPPELAAAPRATVRVATWNVRHLSHRRPPAALALLCDILCRFDLIAMQARPQLRPRDAFTLDCARPRGLKLRPRLFAPIAPCAAIKTKLVTCPPV